MAEPPIGAGSGEGSSMADRAADPEGRADPDGPADPDGVATGEHVATTAATATHKAIARRLIGPSTPTRRYSFRPASAAAGTEPVG